MIWAVASRLRIHLGQNGIVDRSRGERRVARRQCGQIAVSRAGMKIPARIFLDAIDDVLLVHDQIVIRIGVASDVVGVEDFGITNAGGVRRWRLLWPQRQLGCRGTRGEKQQWNEIIRFHGLDLDGSSFSWVTGMAVPPSEASAASMVCRT